VAAPEMPEIAKLQLQQSIETYRVQMTLLVQICGVFVLADGTMVGFAIQQRLAGIIWVGLVFPVTMFLIIRIVYRLTLPVIATAVTIETKYHDGDMTGLMSLFIALGVSQDILLQLRSTALFENEEARLKIYSDLKRPRFAGSSLTRFGLLVVTVGQVIAPLVLNGFFGWSLLSFPTAAK
jgi:hypothetical protein